MTCSKCKGLALFECVTDPNEGLVYNQWKCVNCSHAVQVGPIRSRVAVVERPCEPVGRWAHRR